MKTIIVEDERFARENLVKLLKEIDPKIEIQAQLDSVSDTVEWLKNNQTELIFLDIHLADDLSFKIFEEIEVNIPIIFTTAYDQYALKAFKVNSVDYLLKPIDKKELEGSLAKFNKSKAVDSETYKKILTAIEDSKKNYRERFIVSRGERVMSVKTSEIAYFEGEDRYVFLTKNDGSRFIVDYKLSDLETMLHPQHFFRLNRSFITKFEAIDRIINLSKSRMKIELKPKTKRDIIVSSANSRSFKEWLNR